MCVTLHGSLLTARSGGATQQYCNTTHTFLGVFTNSTVDERPFRRRKPSAGQGFIQDPSVYAAEIFYHTGSS